MKSEAGFSLIETIITIAVLGVIGVAFLGGLGTSSKALAITDERETARNLAQSQMEYVMKQPYAISYAAAPIPGEYDGYTAAIAADSILSRDQDIQKIMVTIIRQGRPIVISESSNCTLMGYKVKR